MDRTTPVTMTEQTETPRAQRRPRAARTAANAVRHGILANIPVLPGQERRSEWRAHLQGILASLQPVGHTELVLAERIAFQLWRLVRIARFEQDTFNVGYDGYVEYPDGEVLQSPLPGRAIAACDILERLQRYEAHLSRELYRAFREFKSLQALRRNTPTERPAALRAQLDQLVAPIPDPANTPAPSPDCDLQPEMQSHTQDCEANPVEAQTQPGPTIERTPSLPGRGQGVGRFQTHQPTPGVQTATKNYETNHVQSGTRKHRPNSGINHPVRKRKRRA